MSIKLTCGDGLVLRLPHEHFEKSVFNNPEIAAARSYTLRCKARSEIVNAVLDMADGESEKVTITADNLEELQNLCGELGFRGLDKEFRAFRGEAGSGSADLKELLQLKERVMRQDKRLTELEHQLNEVLSWKRKVESVSREFQSLESKVEEVARVCEERNLETSRKMDQALRECAKRRDLEELAGNLTQLKENEKKPATKSPAKAEQPATPAKPAPPKPGKRREFVYDSSKPLEGVIAYLTRECGGNVHDKGIVNVTTNSVWDDYPAKNAVDLGTNSEFRSNGRRDSWICYDFKERRVIPTSYSVRSYGGGPGADHLKSWIMEVSNDGSSWTRIDRRENNYDLNGRHVTANFKIPKIFNVQRECVRFIRLKQAGYTHGIRIPSASITISSLEIFGTLFEK